MSEKNDERRKLRKKVYVLKNANAKEAKMKTKRVLEEYFFADLGRGKNIVFRGEQMRAMVLD